jgi:enamine deaminase RidA (YjgF/YER057c/UK114 family)
MVARPRASEFQLPWALRLESFFARAEDHAAFRRVRHEVLPRPFPASTGVVVGLLIPGMLIELQALATRAGKGG